MNGIPGSNYIPSSEKPIKNSSESTDNQKNLVAEKKVYTITTSLNNNSDRTEKKLESLPNLIKENAENDLKCTEFQENDPDDPDDLVESVGFEEEESLISEEKEVGNVEKNDSSEEIEKGNCKY